MIFFEIGRAGSSFRSGQFFPGKAAPARFWHPPKFVGGCLVSAQEDTHYDKIGLYAHNLDTNIGPTSGTLGRVYVSN